MLKAVPIDPRGTTSEAIPDRYEVHVWRGGREARYVEEFELTNPGAFVSVAEVLEWCEQFEATDDIDIYLVWPHDKPGRRTLVHIFHTLGWSEELRPE
jgi:hypothetical protein